MIAVTPKRGIISVENTMNPRKLYRRLLDGHLKNVSFDDLVRLAEQFGFRLSRVSGSHHIMVNAAIGEILNLQLDKNGQAKPYQIRQLLDLVVQHQLEME